MFNKVILASALLASTISVAMANTAPYVGAGLGITANTTTNGGGGNAGMFRGIPVNVFAGYGGVINQDFYLAGELSGTVGTGEISSKNGVRTSYGYGASVIPGVMLSDHTLAFARAGVVRSNFTRNNKMSTGGQFGLGLQTSLTQDIDLRGEYDFTAYRTVSNSSGSVKSPRSDAFNLGVVYKFD